MAGLSRQRWSNATPIRTLFREAFTAAGLPYFNPHSFRTTLALLGEKTCHSPEEFKAWSQNLGHEKVLTTFTSYGNVSSHRQAEIFAGMRSKRGTDERASFSPDAEAVRNAFQVLQKAMPGMLPR